MKEVKNSEYEKKRKRINISLTPSEQEKMISKFRRILTSPEVKEILMNKKIIITKKNSDPQLPAVIRELTKIGNNLNQLVRLANEKKDYRSSQLLYKYLQEIKKTINFLRTYR